MRIRYKSCDGSYLVSTKSFLHKGMDLSISLLTVNLFYFILDENRGKVVVGGAVLETANDLNDLKRLKKEMLLKMKLK